MTRRCDESMRRLYVSRLSNIQLHYRVNVLPQITGLRVRYLHETGVHVRRLAVDGKLLPWNVRVVELDVRQ